jgi:glutamate decarboxylase
VEHLKRHITTPYSSRYGCEVDIPKYHLPEDGIEANAAYQLIHDELDFDGKPNLNMASFVHTYMVRLSFSMSNIV